MQQLKNWNQCLKAWGGSHIAITQSTPWPLFDTEWSTSC